MEKLEEFINKADSAAKIEMNRMKEDLDAK